MQVGHADYVVALAAIPSGTSPIVPGVGLVSGSRDKTVNVWDVEEGASVQQLSGHKYQVNAVGILSGGEVVSGGLDGVLKMWKGGKAVATLSMHKAAILCLCVLSSGQILTGMAALYILCSHCFYMLASCPPTQLPVVLLPHCLCLSRVLLFPGIVS